MTMKWSGRLRMQRLDTDGNPLGPAMYSDQTLRLKLTTDPDGDRRLFAEAPPIRTVSVTATIPRVQSASWFPYEDPRWWFVAAVWRAQNEQLAIESRAGQYRRLWDEKQRAWRRFWQQAVEDGLIAADDLSFPVRRWPPGDPVKWSIEVGEPDD